MILTPVAVPAVTVGAGKVTSWVDVRTSETVMSDGQLIWGASATGVGLFDPPPHPAMIMAVKIVDRTMNRLEII